MFFLMPLSWTEIKVRAIAFSREGSAETREIAEALSSRNAIFNVVGLSRRKSGVMKQPCVPSTEESP